MMNRKRYLFFILLLSAQFVISASMIFLKVRSRQKEKKTLEEVEP